MFDQNKINELVNQAQDMQKTLALAQNEMNQIEVIGVDQHHTVEATINGKHKLKAIKIKGQHVHKISEIESAVIDAVNDAVNKLENIMAKKMMDSISNGVIGNLTKINSIYSKE